jgi:hypothetical protein
MDADRLFLATINDLESRVEPAPDEYIVLGIAALVRKLLLDDLPLVDEVNASRRLPITFRISDAAPIWERAGSLAPVFWSLQDGLDPETSLTRAAVKDVKRDEFLRSRVMFVRGQTITVKDIVLHVANVAGAVHRGTPRDAQQETLRRLEREISVGGYPADVRSLQAIGRIALRALEPLRRQVQLELSAR